MADYIKEMAPETRIVIDRLKRMQIGDVVTYGELSAACGKPVSGQTFNLATARRFLVKHNHMVFEAIRNVGLKRLDDTELATSASDKFVEKSRRHAKRSAQKMACVEDYSRLSPAAQIAHTIKISFFGAIAYMARKGQLEKASRAVAGRSGELPISETLKAFSKE
jgi:alkylated DNA nucleotide flippase Atl1